MKELQAKAKVTQTMTRDGLVAENQADGTVENVSSREAEQDYSTDSEGKTEKILERTEDVKDKHKAKKKAKQAAETAESEDGLHRSAARLELTEEVPNRSKRMKTLGNAVSPPQVFPILKYIADIETGRCPMGGEEP